MSVFARVVQALRDFDEWLLGPALGRNGGCCGCRTGDGAIALNQKGVPAERYCWPCYDSSPQLHRYPIQIFLPREGGDW